ncbi:hypothetical protein BHE74_00052161 [Ensete ventricosum]|nr:hypothetical protein BHE74_00052161 [Ensete ventricosum]
MLSPALMLSSNEETFFANVIKGAPDQQKLLSHRKKKHVENNDNEDCTTNVLKSINLLFPQQTFGFLARYWKPIWFSGFNFAG